VGYVLVYRAGVSGSYLCRLIRPFPAGSLERWLFHSYGPGRYRLLERGRPPERLYLGSLTLNVGQAHAALPDPYAVAPAAPASNGNGNGTHAEPVQVPAGTDYRLALVTVGLPILAEAIKAIATRPARSELSELVAVAKLFQAPKEEQAATFREAIKLYRELAAEAPGQGGAAGDMFNVRDILSGVGELLRAWRESRPAATPPSASGSANPKGNASPATAGAAAELQANKGETAEDFVQRVIVTEIQRAVGSGDSPECLVILIESWLPSHVVAWLEGSPDEEILEELPKKFPAHAEVLQQVGVQQFLRSALQLLREDPELEEVPRVREPAHAAATG